MPKLFVEKTIEINAPASKVWDVLTNPEHTGEWAPEFSGGTEFRIESNWKLGSPVLWRGQDGNVIVVKHLASDHDAGAWVANGEYIVNVTTTDERLHSNTNVKNP